MTFRLRFFIIMSELYEHIIARTNLVNNSFPTSFIDKTFRASTVHRMILHTDIFGKETSQDMSPSPFLIITFQRFIRHSRIANHIDCYHMISFKC